jgi:hypothetical protein
MSAWIPPSLPLLLAKARLRIQGATKIVLKTVALERAISGFHPFGLTFYFMAAKTPSTN